MHIFRLLRDVSISGPRAVPRAPLVSTWVSSLHVPYLLLPAFPLHFRIFAVQPVISDLPYNTSSLHPSSMLLLHIPCCTQDQLIYSSHFVFFSFAPLVVVSTNGVVFLF
jgi:hypothetical protein